MRNLSIDHDGEVATISFDRPILTKETLIELAEALDEMAQNHTPEPIVLVSAHPTIFLAGAHLGEIADLDSECCIAYARLGRSVAAALGRHPAPVVAAIGGSCSGGGFDLVMAADTIVASPDAVFSHPGILRGLVTGWGGTESIAHSIGDAPTRRALLEAKEFDAAQLAVLGAIRSIVSDPPAAARLLALEMTHLDPSRIAIWRHLRGSNFVDRFRAFVVEKS